MANRTLVLYAYFEKDLSCVDNLKYFINVGYRDYLDFVFVVNGDECSVDIPIDRPNVKMIKRANSDYDFGAYYDALKGETLSEYDFFVFLNTSVRGPFLPLYCQYDNWTTPFLNMITSDVKLVGTTVNVCVHVRDTDLLNQQGFYCPFPHVQSQFFATDREALVYLLNDTPLFRQPPETDFHRFVTTREICMSLYILKKGWNINSIIPEYNGLDYRTILQNPNAFSTKHGGDPCYERALFGRTLHPYECIFIKTNRNLNKEAVDSISKYNMTINILHKK